MRKIFPWINPLPLSRPVIVPSTSDEAVAQLDFLGAQKTRRTTVGKARTANRLSTLLREPPEPVSGLPDDDWDAWLVGAGRLPGGMER